MLIGAHMSIAGGVDQAPLRGETVGCKVIQIFTKSSNQWKARALKDEEISNFKKNQESTGISEIIAHDSYLINLASPDEEARKKSLNAFVEEMERCKILGIKNLVMHPGSHKGSGEDEGIKAITAEFNEILSITDGWDINITIETTAGQGTNLGYKFEHIAKMIDGVKAKDRMKVCFDTCHVFAAGYDITTEAGYKETMDKFDSLIGIDRLVAFHINDSKKALGSRVDRHEQLGKGFMGEAPFRFIMNDDRLTHIPKILETPKGKEMDKDRVNLAFLRGVVE